MGKFGERPVSEKVLRDAGLWPPTPKRTRQPAKPRKPKVSRSEAEQEALNPGMAAWRRELEVMPGVLEWSRTTKSDRNFDPLGFYEHLIRGKLDCRLKDAAGEGRVGIGPLKPRPWQKALARDIIAWRQTQTTRWMELVVKSRQLGFSTFWDAFIWADALCNPGAGAAVAAHQDSTLMALQRNFRIFAKQNKDQGVAKRMSDKLFETLQGAYVRLCGANDALIRGDSPRHLHVSEADYVEDLEDALKSALPAVERSQFATVTLETTIQRNMNTEFKDFVERCRKGRTDYRIRFLSWIDDDTAQLTMDAKQQADFLASIDSSDNHAREYERMLRDKLGLSAGQIAWWRQVLRQDAAGDVQAAIEIAPTSLEEALEFTKGAEFFKPDAVEFYERNVRPPSWRYRMTFDGAHEVPVGDLVVGDILEVWHQPEHGKLYRIGADAADAEKRTVQDGSENFMVVLDEDTGTVCATWHGYTSASEFGAILAQVAERYNRACIVPEVAFGGDAVVDFLRKTAHYSNIYQREVFGKTGISQVMVGTDGFAQRSNTRDILKDRVQEAFNERLFDIPSRYLLDQLLNFGRRGGVKVRRRGNPNVLPDDGVIALGLTCFGHDKMAKRHWQPKANYVAPVIRVEKPAMRGGIKIERERKRELQYDPRSNSWR